MLAQETSYYAERDISKNYEALELVLTSKYEPSVKQALIATQFLEDSRAKKRLVNNYKKHNFTLADALAMAKFREDTGSSYVAIGFQFNCSDSHAYKTLQKYGLIKEWGGRRK